MTIWPRQFAAPRAYIKSKRWCAQSKQRALSRLLTATLVFVGALPLCAKEAMSLRFYNWTDYIDESVLVDFTKQTGIRVEYSTFESNEELEEKLKSQRSGFDLVVTSGQFLARQKGKNLFHPLDKSLITNARHLSPALMEKLQASDPGNSYGLPYMWGTNVFAYNKAKIAQHLGPTAPLRSWKLMMEPEWLAKLSACGVAFLDSPSEVFPEVLRHGRALANSTDPSAYVAAERHLTKMAAQITYFGGDEIIDDLASGKICAAVSYSGDLAQARTMAQENNVGQIELVLPEEGAELWFDLMAIPANAPHAKQAHQLVNFLLQPAIMARLSNHIEYANAVPDSWPLIEPAIRNDPVLFPNENGQKRLYTLPILTDAIYGLQERIWNKLKKTKPVE